MKAIWKRHSRRRLQFQVLSDLHLEVGQQYSTYQIPPCAPYLVLAGDIGRLVDYEGYLRFLSRHIKQYRLIFLVLGNHEFYHTSFEDGIRLAQRLEREVVLLEKVVLLHRRSYRIVEADVTVHGCTLWSRISDQEIDAVLARVNDFRRIHRWSVHAHNEAHHRDLEWLKAQISVAQQLGELDKPSRHLIVTHHAPSLAGTSDPHRSSSNCGSAFATDLISNAHWSGVDVWLFGHTHYSTAFMLDGVRVIANQRGYVLDPSQEAVSWKERKRHRFDAKKVISI